MFMAADAVGGSLPRKVHLVNPSDSSFGVAVITPRRNVGGELPRKEHFWRLALRRELSALVGGGLYAVFFAFGLC